MSFMRTDLGNSERLIDQHGEDLRHCHPFHKWFCWDGTRWRLDDSGGPMRAAKLAVRSIYTEAAEAETEQERKDLANWAKESESSSRIRAMLSLAASDADVVVLPADLDADPWLLAVEGGVLDLRTGELGAPDRSQLVTKLAGCAYDPEAQAPTWAKFLERVTDGDTDLIGFLQRAVGYSLTGDTGEECLFLPYGGGRNGKSKFLGAVRAMLGDYAQQLPREALMSRRQAGIPNDLARLAGARFATAIETRKSQRLDEELVKQLTGNDPVTARFLHAEFFEFQPQAKIWLATNYKPKVVGTDDAIWARIRLIPFTVTIPKPEQDKQLGAKLQAELPGILRWAVEGCHQWQAEGLGEPQAVEAATQAYRLEQDVLASFIDQCCALDETQYTYAKDLHDTYQEFTGERISQKELGTLLAERGFDVVRKGHGGKRAWLGIGLLGASE
jgi:putative DNA primase/helicase